jgi:adenylate cyclase, class 2
MQQPEEIEAKYRLDGPADHARLRARLAALGAQPGGRVAERNLLFDQPDRALQAAGRVLRLRVLDGGPGARLTFKGPAAHADGLKRRVELETPVTDAAATRAILEALGYQPTLEYAKERETWRLDGTEVALDTLDFGCYCEIEGAPEAIARVASALALPSSAVEPAGYPALQARHRAGRLA